MLSKSLSIFFSIYFFLNQCFINFLITLFRMIYEPREDSVLLKKWVKKLVKGKVLDMGTGSGVQALAALEKTKDVLAADINPECVEYVKKKGVNALQSDLFSNITEKFDWIIFNPPYLPEDLRTRRFQALNNR